jgi:disulfide oxidoreductase YuzD
MKINVYGMEVLCASCVGAPSSRETSDWLNAAIKRKYPEHPIVVEYIDVEMVQSEKSLFYLEKFETGELFYPLVEINDEIVDEGIIQLKKIVETIDRILEMK